MSTPRQYVIYCLDKDDDGSAIRKANIDAHRAYVGAAGSKVLLAGPIMSQGHAEPVGSLFILEVDSAEDASGFNIADPFTRAGLWKEVTVRPFQIARHSLS
jgi:uncharacterized protein YciI